MFEKHTTEPASQSKSLMITSSEPCQTTKFGIIATAPFAHNKIYIPDEHANKTKTNRLNIKLKFEQPMLELLNVIFSAMPTIRVHTTSGQLLGT